MASVETFQVGFSHAPDLPDGGRVDFYAADLQGPPIHIDTFCFYRENPEEPFDKPALVTAFKTGLQKTLDLLPRLAGHLTFDANGELHIQTNPDSTVRLDVRDVSPDPNFPDYDSLASRYFPPHLLPTNQLLPYMPGTFLNEAMHEPIDGTPVLFAQVTFFRGGLCITVAPQHKTTDIRGVDHLLKAFAAFTNEALTGRPAFVEPFGVDRSWLKERVLTPIEVNAILKTHPQFRLVPKASPQSSYLSTTSTIKPCLVRFPPASLRRLKALCAPAPPTTLYVSTYDSIFAFLWQALVRIRHRDPRFAHLTHTAALHAVNLRRYPHVPPCYFGQAFSIGQTPFIPIATLLSPPGLPLGAAAIRAVTLACDPEYFHATNNLTKTLLASTTHKLDSTINWDGLDVMASSWSQMALDEYDFGFGPCDTVRAPEIPINNYLKGFWPYRAALRDEVGVVASFNLEEACAAELKKDERVREFAEFP